MCRVNPLLPQTIMTRSIHVHDFPTLITFTQTPSVSASGTMASMDLAFGAEKVLWTSPYTLITTTVLLSILSGRVILDASVSSALDVA